MGSLGISGEFWKDRGVFLTGHTGFKGAWLSLWLDRLGARVTGYALEPPTEPNLFEAAGVAELLVADHRADVLELARLEAALSDAQPQIVFHLAAQSLVRQGYREPIPTYATNVLGTAHLLEAVRRVASVRAVLVVTTDKCYENRERGRPFRETDVLGGADPYSSSKACAELVTAAYRSSYFSDGDTVPAIASVRAGNVIGGGDWAEDRLIPDCIRAFQTGGSVVLRNPQAVRPWQHVLEPLGGYLLLAERMCADQGGRWAGGWNFGPDGSGEATVLEVARRVAEAWGGGARVEIDQDQPAPRESACLRLDSTKARTTLGWSPRWSLTAAVEATVDWYRSDDPRDCIVHQLERYGACEP